MQIKAVVFDLGGVLIDWDPRHLYRQLFADQNEMERFLAEICTSSWHLEHDLGADVGESCRRLADAHPGDREMIMAWAERGEEMAAGQFDETVAILTELKAAGQPCYALSNMEPDRYAIRRQRFGFMQLFDGCVISGIERVAKPDPRIFRILLDRYRLAAEAVLFIDDSPRNVEAARALGMHALVYQSADRLRRDLRAAGVAGLGD